MNKKIDNFTLALKIGNEQCKFNISFDDDQEILFQKLKHIYPQCKDKK